MPADDARDDERGPEALLARTGGAVPPGGDHGVPHPSDKTSDDSKFRLWMSLGAVTDRLIATAPRIPVRDLPTLRAQFPGLGPEQLADRLEAGAVKASSSVGAGVGAAAMLPAPPVMAAELATEVVAVASIEVKLIAELYEVYGLRPPGTRRQRALAHLTAWTHQRGVEVTAPSTLHAAFGGQLRRELRQRLVRRSVRNLPTLTPLMVGAAVGAVTNRRDTRKLARRVRADLRTRQRRWDDLPEQTAA